MAKIEEAGERTPSRPPPNPADLGEGSGHQGERWASNCKVQSTLPVGGAT